VVICLERDAELHVAQLMPLPPTVSCFSKIQIGFTFLVPAHLGSLGQRAIKRVCMCVCVHILAILMHNVASYVRKILSLENFLKICVTMLCCSRSKNVFICVMFRKNDHKYVKCICVAKLYVRRRIQSVLMC